MRAFFIPVAPLMDGPIYVRCDPAQHGHSVGCNSMIARLLVTKFLYSSQVDGAVASSLLHISELKVRDDFAIHFLLVAPKWRGRELQYFLRRKSIPDVLPGRGSYMVCLTHNQNRTTLQKAALSLWG